ncbi:MAG TPA: exonuclease domain-containing protein [Bacteroidales bacterium]|nr:exonuclease domain-containing protein [Bacteroidales bacterium]
MEFAVVDLETTGGLPSRDRIIEIGIVIITDGEVTDRYESLVNPERSIPPFIANMTGISNEAVKAAPKFFEIAKDIVLKLKGRIFVAHNVNFDYNFLRYEFQQLGYAFSSRRLCTVQLSRKLYPEYKSHGLSKLVKRFNLNMTDRHRALGDAQATAEFLLLSFQQKTNTPAEIKHLVNFGLQSARLPQNISIEDLHKLPEKPGVYFLMDDNNEFAYIGKSDNIKRRIFEHFGKGGKKTSQLLRSVHHIEYELTPGNLIALLKEDQYIKKYNPPINKAQKRTSFPYVIVKHQKSNNTFFKVHTHTRAEKQKWEVIAEFGQRKHAYAHLENVSRDLGLCACRIQDKTQSKCWKRQTNSCPIPENMEEPISIDLLENQISQYFPNDQIIWESLSNENSIGFIKIQSGICTAFGELSNQESIHSLEELENHSFPYSGTSYTNKVIFRELSMRRKKYNIIPL